MSWANSRTLLTNGAVKFFVLVLALVPPPLVENSNSVDSDGGLTSLTVTDDQLTLAATNWNHGLLESAGKCLHMRELQDSFATHPLSLLFVSLLSFTCYCSRST